MLGFEVRKGADRIDDLRMIAGIRRHAQRPDVISNVGGQRDCQRRTPGYERASSCPEFP